MYGPFHVDIFGKKVDSNYSFLCKDINEKMEIFFVGEKKKFQFKMSATMVILKIVSHVKYNILTLTSLQIVILTQIMFLKIATLSLLFHKAYVYECTRRNVSVILKCVFDLDNGNDLMKY